VSSVVKEEINSDWRIGEGFIHVIERYQSWAYRDVANIEIGRGG
jgi:hypothetical protein